jgi:hypothetical protein
MLAANGDLGNAAASGRMVAHPEAMEDAAHCVPPPPNDLSEPL